MTNKNDIEVIIHGKVYRLGGYESEEYLQKVASYLNNKIHECEQMESYVRLNQETKNILLNINIAADYMEAKNRADMIESEAQSRDRQLYDVKHELVEEQLKNDTLSGTLKELRAEKEKLEKENIRLKALLDAADKK